MPQSKKPKKPLQQTDQQRLVSLTSRLSELAEVKQLTEHNGFQQLLNIMQAEVKRRRVGRDSIHWDSTADEFQAYEKKSLYAAGFIQGVEFGVNVLMTIPQEYAKIESDIKQLRDKMKGEGKK